MKKNTIVCILLFLLFFIPSISVANEEYMIIEMSNSTPGEILSVVISDNYPTIGKPIDLFIRIAGKAESRFNQTILITDEFFGLVTAGNTMNWVSGNVTVSEFELTIGRLPTYIKKITWYPTLVGNHTFHFLSGTLPSKQLNISVGFTSQGVIIPALGCPSIVTKNNSEKLTVTISEKRNSSEEKAQILQVTLETRDNAFCYQLQNQTTLWHTWIQAGMNAVEDWLVACYDIQDIPVGFYNIEVTTTKETYSWANAVKIIKQEPTEYTIVQLTDIHIGKYTNIINEKKEFARVIDYLNEHIQPDFIIVSGDSVDWYNKKSFKNAYIDLQDILMTSNSPVFTTPGNHERYGNRLLFLYFPFTDLTGYHRFLSPVNDYSFNYGGINYILLDSGHDYSRWEIKRNIWSPTPEASGLTNMQMFLLKNFWGNNHMNQIITMHHPAVNDKNDTGLFSVPNDLPSGNNECIVFNRGEFISYCILNNVSLILSGHCHKNRVMNYLGKEPEHPSQWPLFLHTDSVSLNRMNNGGRIIHIKNSTIVSYEYVPFV